MWIFLVRSLFKLKRGLRLTIIIVKIILTIFLTLFARSVPKLLMENVYRMDKIQALGPVLS